VQPSGERLAHLEHGVGAAQQAEERFLRHVLGPVAVAQDAVRGRVHDAGVAAHDGRERLGVALLVEPPQ
jgi:hypothetical protein